MVGSTVNPMDKGGKEYKDLWADSDPFERNANGRTRSGFTGCLSLPMNPLRGSLTFTETLWSLSQESAVEGVDGDMIFGSRST